MSAPIGEWEPIDSAGDDAVGPSVELVRRWLAAAEAALTRGERRGRERMHRLTSDPGSVAFTMAFCDRVIRPDDDAVAASELRSITAGPLPAFLSALDRLMLRAGARLSVVAPRVVMPLARRRMRQIVGDLVVDSGDPGLAAHLQALEAQHFRVNTNLLGESVLGEEEAARRLAATVALLERPDVTYVSVKASAVASQLNLWGYDDTLERVKLRLRRLYEAAMAGSGPPSFVNLDMEEYRDLRLTVDAFTQLLSEPRFHRLEAGIVLQAYLPDSFALLGELVDWAGRRQAAGGADIKVRIVKGANLAMEAVDAAMHGWEQAPYASKVETDANYKRLVDWAFVPHHLGAVRIGVASHNVFDLAWARSLSTARGVADRVEFEMLHGMAPSLDRTVLDATGRVLLYTPVVADADFDTALAYLFRRLEENSKGDNFLRHVFDLARDPEVFAAEEQRFREAVALRTIVGSAPRRRGRMADTPGFANRPDTDPTDAAARDRALSAVRRPIDRPLPAEVTDRAAIDELVAVAAAAAPAWAALASTERARLLRDVSAELERLRPELIAVMAHEAHKTLAEGDVEVSEASDFAAYYAEQVPGLPGEERSAAFRPLGTVVVVPPWNFPVAIPAGGVLTALAAGNSVILKPAPEVPRCALAVAEACWAAGVPREVLQYVRAADGPVGAHLVGHRGIHGIVLTGALETAELFRRLAPDTPLFAETSGKDAIVVLPDADLDLAAADLVRSAFGHAGQKCSAASLAILVGSAYDSTRLRRQLVDAARSLVTGPASDPATALAPLIGPPGDKLRRALTKLDPGERWVLKPELLDAHANLWSPGIKEGVQPGSWFHRTECFGPVLGLMAAADLDEAIAIQNGTPFGLTGGLHTLDPAEVDRWLERVEVGNAYVNRPITGAMVRRQPFGGWKGSVVGPGAKAGGPNTVAQLGHWSDGAVGSASGQAPASQPGATPRRGSPDSPTETEMGWSGRRQGAPASQPGATPRRGSPDSTTARPSLDADAQAWLEAALASDARWQRLEFGVDHDPSALFCEANVFRYRPLRRLVVRAEADARPEQVVRVLAAARLAGTPTELSTDPGWPVDPAGWVSAGEAATVREDATALTARLLADPPDRVRVVGTRSPELDTLPPTCFVDDRPVLADARVEGLRYRREQSISRTLHRFGYLTVDLSSG